MASSTGPPSSVAGSISASAPRALYAFDLPQPLVRNLQVCHVLTPLARRSGRQESRSTAAGSTAATGSGSTSQSNEADQRTCRTCPASGPFDTPQDIKVHLRSDLHRLNVRIAASSSQGGKGQPKLLTQQEFEKACEDADTASDTDLSADDGTSPRSKQVDLVSRLAAALTISSNAPSDGEEDEQDISSRTAIGNADSAHLWLEPRPDTAAAAETETVLPMADAQLGFHRALFPDLAVAAEEEGDARAYVERNIAAMQAERHTRKSGPHSVGGWLRKRIKSGKAADAGRACGLVVLDGDGYVPGLKLAKKDSMEEEDEDESSDAYESGDGEGVASESSGDETTTATGSTSGSTSEPPLRIWTVLMMGGGHFSAAAILLNPHVTTTHSRKRGTTEERGLVVLAHKSFHRYTTRKKQGGSQSAQDASGKFAKSAGAQLRRYGEESLKDDIKGLLDLPGWRTLLARSERIWVRAGARSAKSVLWAWEGAGPSGSGGASPLDPARRDGRLLNLPIQTRRANLGEVLRCFFELARVRIAHHSPAELQRIASERAALEAEHAQKGERKRAAEVAKQQRANQRADEAMSRKVQSRGEVLTEEQKVQRQRVERFLDMVQRGRVELVDNFLAKYSFGAVLKGDAVDAPLPDWWRQAELEGSHSERALIPSTLLQLAASADSPEMLQYLLVERRADPTIAVPPLASTAAPQLTSTEATTTATAPSPVRKTAYDLCNTKPARDVFRRLMGDQPDWWDWAQARVPSALTADLQETQAAKAKDRRAALRDKARARAAKETSSEDVASPSAPPEQQQAQETPSHTSRNRLGGYQSATRVLKDSLSDAHLTPEMRARIEREKRARAAEARFAANPSD